MSCPDMMCCMLARYAGVIIAAAARADSMSGPLIGAFFRSLFSLFDSSPSPSPSASLSRSRSRSRSLSLSRFFRSLSLRPRSRSRSRWRSFPPDRERERDFDRDVLRLFRLPRSRDRDLLRFLRRSFPPPPLRLRLRPERFLRSRVRLRLRLRPLPSLERLRPPPRLERRLFLDDRSSDPAAPRTSSRSRFASPASSSRPDAPASRASPRSPIPRSLRARARTTPAHRRRSARREVTATRAIPAPSSNANEHRSRPLVAGTQPCLR
jgi:hypothetical protein